LALAQGFLKLGLNVYRSWAGESAVRWLRNEISRRAQQSNTTLPSDKAGGVEIAMVVAETDPIGSFVGSSFSEPLLQGGVLLAVFGYLVYLQPLMALVGILVFLPQSVLVPLIQGAINRRVGARIWILRKISIALVDTVERNATSNKAQAGRVDQVFHLNMGIYQLKFTLNFAMNILSSIGTAVILGLGGYFVIQGQTEIGTVVAFVSGLSKITAPWGDLVNWFRDYRVTHARYGLVVSALRGETAAARPANSPAAGTACL
jgi:ABC-type bacteriocin/lantibiotic exporter with double-glycine peptidase domain